MPLDVASIFDGVTVHDLYSLKNQSLRFPASPPQLNNLSEQELQDDFVRAQQWLVEITGSQAKLVKREQYMRMFRSAVSKEMSGAQQQWSDMERLYMALTDPNLPDPQQRVQMAALTVLQFGFTVRLSYVSMLATQRQKAEKRVSILEEDTRHIREGFFDRSRDSCVDDFACAIPLATLKQRPDIVDDNEGCCPVCQNSYTDISTNTIEDLLADFPVRIKYCGHIIGKACLEQWMNTAKIDEAKYPHRTCPMCRVKIEGTKPPPLPKSLIKHVMSNGRATETANSMLRRFDMDVDESLDTIAKLMSEEIACEELLAVVKGLAGKTRWGHESEERIIEDKMDDLKDERWVWGFRGDRAWKQIRDEWMGSGVVREE
jgi:hypothetical protein